MTDYKLLERLSSIRDMLLGDQRRKVEELITDIKFDMESGKLPKDSVTVAKAAAKFAKDCYKEWKDKNKRIAGAGYYVDSRDGSSLVKRQFILEPALGVSYSKPFEGLVEIDKDVDPIDFNSVINRKYSEGSVRFMLPDRAKLKNAIKMESATKGERTYCRLEDGKCIDAALLVRAMELTGCNGGEMIESINHKLYPAFIRRDMEDGNQITCIILPCRTKPENEDSLVLWDCAKQN